MTIGRFVSGALLLAILAAGCSLSMPWSKAPVTDPTAEALFAEGMRYFKDKRYVRAIDAFTKLRSEYPFSPLLTDTELKIADAHYMNDQYPEAITAFKEFQALHPTSEHVPFVLLRLGQAHFNQFTNVNRDPKNTEIAKGYFEAVLTNHPKSPHVAEAREKLAKCNGILAQHDFNIAEFYFKQEKYPAARDRFEEIVRKYSGTPVASRSLYLLGESYRIEKNNVKAALAYEALLQHYPSEPLAAAAKTQLAQIEKEKQDPLAMLLMRDRRPTAVAAPVEARPEPAAVAKIRETNNLLAKTEVVYEAPGGERGFFRRVVDKINPFSSSDNERKPEEKKSDPVVEQLASKNKAAKDNSKGFFSALWPFGGDEPKKSQAATAKDGNRLVERIDASLEQQGIDATQTAALKTPAIDLPNVDNLKPRQPTTDTTKLLGDIDSNLKQEGMHPAEMPASPQPSEVFNEAERQAAIAKAKPKPSAPDQSTLKSGLLSNIDQKLKGQGVEPLKFEETPPAAPTNRPTAKPAAQTQNEVNLESKRGVEKGPLFLGPEAVPAVEQPADESRAPNQTPPAKTEEPAERDLSQSLVRGPQPAGSEAGKSTAPNKPSSLPEQGEKGTFDQFRRDLENVQKLLNPFSW